MLELKEVPTRVWGSTGLLVIGRLWRSVCTLVVLYVTARRLPPDDFGRFTFYLAVFMLLDSLADMGTANASIQWTAEHPERVPAVLRLARRTRLFMGAVGMLLVTAGTLVTGEPGAVWIILASAYPMTHALELSNLVFKNRIDWRRPVLIRAVAAALSLTFVLALLAGGSRSPAQFLFAYAAGSVIGNLLQHLVSRHLLTQAAKDSEGVALRPFLWSALPMGIAGLCQQTYFYVDNLFIRAQLGETPLGHYNIAMRVMSYAIMVAVFAPLAALPWLTREAGKGQLGRALTDLSQPLFALAGLGTGLVWPFCEPLLALFGDDFVAAAPSLRWLLFACAAVYLGAPWLTGVVASGRSASVLAVALVGLAFNLVANSLWIPRHGIEGAAAATFGTEIVVAAGALFSLARAGAALPLHRRPWAWLIGPLLFALGRTLSDTIFQLAAA